MSPFSFSAKNESTKYNKKDCWLLHKNNGKFKKEKKKQSIEQKVWASLVSPFGILVNILPLSFISPSPPKKGKTINKNFCLVYCEPHYKTNMEVVRLVCCSFVSSYNFFTNGVLHTPLPDVLKLQIILETKLHKESEISWSIGSAISIPLYSA